MHLKKKIELFKSWTWDWSKIWKKITSQPVTFSAVNGTCKSSEEYYIAKSTIHSHRKSVNITLWNSWKLDC